MGLSLPGSGTGTSRAARDLVAPFKQLMDTIVAGSFEGQGAPCPCETTCESELAGGTTILAPCTYNTNPATKLLEESQALPPGAFIGKTTSGAVPAAGYRYHALLRGPPIRQVRADPLSWLGLIEP